jgi:tetratricopeptide (TPR) repeat protein
MKRPQFLETRRPVYQIVFVLSLVLFLGLIGAGVVQAWRLFRSAPTIRINPVILGDKFVEEKKFEEALREYQETVSVDPENFEAWSKIGGIYGRMGDHERQLENYRRALAVRPREPLLLANAGNACFQLKRFDEAAAYYRRAAKLSPNSAEIQNSLGGALAMMGDFAGAIPHFERALELQPDHPSARRNLENARRDAARTIILHNED